MCGDPALDTDALLAAPPVRRPIRPIVPDTPAVDAQIRVEGGRPADDEQPSDGQQSADERPLEIEPTPPPPPATAKDRAAPADGRVPCHACGYDLRASLPGSRCPECGTIVPTSAELEAWNSTSWSLRDEIRAVFRAAPDAARDAMAERRRRREEQLDAWSGLATASLAAIALVSPVPFLGSIGLVGAAAMVFAPLFRLIHLRTLAAAPGPIVSRLGPQLSRAHAANLVDIAVGCVVVLFAIAGTVSALPPRAERAYPVLIAVWWSFATLSLLHQLELAAASNRVFTPPTNAAPQPSRRIRVLLTGGVAGAIAGVALVAATNLAPNALGATLSASIKVLGVLVSIGGMVVFAFGAVAAWGFLSAASRCAFESPVFEQLRTKAPDLDELPKGVVRHGKTPDHGPPAVEMIDLPPPSAEFLAETRDDLPREPKQ
ncbi:MAG: hypothetical protein GC172_12540 [Phycisphaera sp.]|nr:hypothetical protein [Phycisphaera sp.]